MQRCRSKAFVSAARILDELKYENVLNELDNLSGLEISVNDNLDKLRKVRDDRQFKNENEELISDSISKTKSVLNDLEKKREEIKTKAESLALAQLKKYESELSRAINREKVVFAENLNDITKPKSDQDQNKEDKDYKEQNITRIDDMIASMDCKIYQLERLAKELAIFHENLGIGKRENLGKINIAIGLAKTEKHLLEIKKEFLQFGYKDGNNTKIIDIVVLAKSQREKENLCFDFIIENKVDVLKYLIECESVDINFSKNDEDGNSLLHEAMECESIETIKYLLSKGANINLENRNKETPLDIAKKSNNPEIISLLKK